MFSLLYRVVKQSVAPDVSVLGGVSHKALLPAVLEKLSVFLSAFGLDITSGLHTATSYRIEIRGNIYYSRAYQRVKERNSYTVAYLSNGAKKFALIEYFVYLHNRVLAVLNPLSFTTCKYHFDPYHICFRWLCFHHSCDHRKHN